MPSSIKSPKPPMFSSQQQTPGPTSWDDMKRVKEEEYFEKQNREQLKKILAAKPKENK